MLVYFCYVYWWTVISAKWPSDYKMQIVVEAIVQQEQQRNNEKWPTIAL